MRKFPPSCVTWVRRKFSHSAVWPTLWGNFLTAALLEFGGNFLIVPCDPRYEEISSQPKFPHNNIWSTSWGNSYNAPPLPSTFKSTVVIQPSLQSFITWCREEKRFSKCHASLRNLKTVTVDLRWVAFAASKYIGWLLDRYIITIHPFPARIEHIAPWNRTAHRVVRRLAFSWPKG